MFRGRRELDQIAVKIAAGIFCRAPYLHRETTAIRLNCTREDTLGNRFPRNAFFRTKSRFDETLEPAVPHQLFFTRYPREFLVCHVSGKTRPPCFPEARASVTRTVRTAR